MKELPKPILVMLLVVGFLLLGLVVYELFINNSEQTSPEQYLDQLQVDTHDPQPAGINTAQ